MSHHPLIYFLPSLILPYPRHKMDDIDGIYNRGGLKLILYYKIFDAFWFINIDGDQNIGKKDFVKDEWYMLKDFHPTKFNWLCILPKLIHITKERNVKNLGQTSIARVAIYVFVFVSMLY
jgi:hypothetical protein